jgi:hypothetical protein
MIAEAYFVVAKVSEVNRAEQGCQMVYLYAKNADFNSYLKALRWKNLVCFIAIWYIFGPLSILFGHLFFV